MIGRVKTNPITGCKYAETLAGPQAGTVQKLGLSDDCNYEVVLSAGDRDVDGESYVGVSTCCPVTYNPETGTFKVCTLEVGSINGNLDADRIREYDPTGLPVGTAGVIGAVTCATIVDGKTYGCLYDTGMTYDYNANLLCMANSVYVPYCPGNLKKIYLKSATYCASIYACNFEFITEYAGYKNTRCMGLYKIDGCTCTPSVQTCEIRTPQDKTIPMCICTCSGRGTIVTGPLVTCSYLASSSNGLRLGVGVDPNLGTASNYAALIEGYNYSDDAEPKWNDTFFGVSIGCQCIIRLCGNCFTDCDWCYNVGPNNAVFDWDDGIHYASDTTCCNMFIGAYNWIRPVCSDCGRCNMMIGFANHICVNCDCDTLCNMMVGWYNCLGTGADISEGNYGSVNPRENVVVGRNNSLYGQSLGNVVVGCGNCSAMCQGLCWQGVTVIGQSNFQTTNHTAACVYNAVIIGCQNQICQYQCSSMSNVVGIGYLTRVGHCYTVAIGSGAYAIACGMVAIGRCAGWGCYNNTGCFTQMPYGTYIGQNTGFYQACGVCFDSYQHLSGRAWKVRVSIAQNTLHCNFNKAWHCYIRCFVCKGLDPSCGYNHTYRFVGYGAEIMQSDTCSDPLMNAAGGYICGGNIANNLAFWRSGCWGTFTCTDTNSDWWSRGRGEYDLLVEVSG